MSQPSQIWPVPKPVNVIPPTSGSLPAASFSRIFSAASGEDGIQPREVSAEQKPMMATRSNTSSRRAGAGERDGSIIAGT